MAVSVAANAVGVAFLALLWFGPSDISTAQRVLGTIGFIGVFTLMTLSLARPAWRLTAASTPGGITVHPDRLVIVDEAILTAPVVLERSDIALVRTADGRDSEIHVGDDEANPPAAFLGIYPAAPTVAIRMRVPLVIPGRRGGDLLFSAPRRMRPPLVHPPSPGTSAEVLFLATPAASELLQWWLGTTARDYDVG